MRVIVLPANYALMDNGYTYRDVDRLYLRYKGELHADMYTHDKAGGQRTLTVELTNVAAVMIDNKAGDDVKTDS